MNKLKFILFTIGLSILPTKGFSYEVECFGAVFDFAIEKNSDFNIGMMMARGNVLDQVALKEVSVETAEYQKLIALYTGRTSEDQYKLFIFKEMDQESHISFLETVSVLGRKKVIELRCNFND